MAAAAAMVIPTVVPVAIELIRLAGELIASYRQNGGTLTDEQKAALWSEHARITGSILEATPVPEPPA